LTEIDEEVLNEAVAKARIAAALPNSPTGPGTSGYTTSGAAYRGPEVAESLGVPGPDERGFANDRKGKLGDDGPA
jgi:hypothetical protein